MYSACSTANRLVTEFLTLEFTFILAYRSQVGCGPTAKHLFCFAKKGAPKKATVDSPLRGAYATLQHNLCFTKNGKVLKLAALRQQHFLIHFLWSTNYIVSNGSKSKTTPTPKQSTSPVGRFSTSFYRSALLFLMLILIFTHFWHCQLCRTENG